MPVNVREDNSAEPEASARIFRRRLNGVDYADIPPLRLDLVEFLEKHGAGPSYAGMIALTVTEVLTNLAKHPPRKAGDISVGVELAARSAVIDIADDSTPFAEFDAKCETALAQLNAVESMAEVGYGLGVILRQHADVCYVPAGESPDGLNHFRVRDSRNAAAIPPVRRGLVFLVDDDPVATQMHKYMLDGQYDVVAFDNAPAAAAAFARLRPDIVVSDLDMPGMDGAALRRALSLLDGGNTTPFIFLSAQRAGETSPYINALGVDDFLCKPVQRQKLVGVISRLVTRARQVRQALEGKFHQELTHLLEPALPARYGRWRISTLSRMAEAGGGDFTLHAETPACLMAVLADVMGHGPQAKFFAYAYAGYLRSMFRVQAHAPDPARFLDALSRSIEGDAVLENIIMTCQSFQFFGDGRVAIASAGHPCPILMRASGIKAVDIAGPLPGLSSDIPYGLKTMTLAPGDKILFATDGFFHAFDKDGYRQDGILQALSTFAGTNVAAKLWHDSLQRAGPAPADDATLIIAEYGGDET